MRHIILDCDPGHDDAIAIMLAGNSKNITLRGITVVAGNQTIEKTANNALNVSQYLDIPVKVYSGCSEPLIKEKQQIAADIHGETGLDGPTFESLVRKSEDKHAVLYIIEEVLNSKEPITLVATGPLTNIALALKLEPKIKDNIQEIVIMGGSTALGNMTPAAEFNILVDGEAAAIVFNSGLHIVMVGLDVTRKVLVLPEIVERMGKISNRASQLFVDLMQFFNKTQKEVFGWDGGPLHDPLTIAYLIDPSVVKTRLMNVQIDIKSEQSYGRTNCDIFGMSDGPKNSSVCLEVDIEKYWDIVEEGIRQYA